MAPPTGSGAHGLRLRFKPYTQAMDPRFRGDNLKE
jgi:hypothetical protein